MTEDEVRAVQESFGEEKVGAVRDTLAEWGRRDGARLAAALRGYTQAHLRWIMDSFRSLPDGPKHDQARSLYPEPFPFPGRDSTGSVGASEIFAVACAEQAVDPATIPPETRASLAVTYWHHHSEGWFNQMRLREDQGRLDAAEGDSPQDRRDRRNRVRARAREIAEHRQGLTGLAFDDALTDELHAAFPYLAQLRALITLASQADDRKAEAEGVFDLTEILDRPESIETQLARDAYEAALRAVVFGRDE